MRSRRTVRGPYRRALAMLCGAVASVAIAGSAAAEYQLVWQDEFASTQVDPAKWEFQIGTGCPTLCGWGNNELQYYRAENAVVANGLLTITAKAESFGGKSYTSARMRTRNRGDWTYGRFEMRAKLPIGPGIWPALWMLPTDNVYGGWPASGEIDILEYIGQNPADVFGTIHYGGPTSTFVSNDYVLPSGTFHDDFHIFALEWDPYEIRWYVDGTQYGCDSHWWSTGGNYPAPFDQRFHLLLNMAVGGNLPGPPNGTTVFPQQYIVDWVRVYQDPSLDPSRRLLFDGMDHANPFGNGWFTFNGNGGGGIAANTTDLPPNDGCRASLAVGWGGPAGFVGGFGRRFPSNLADMTQFEFWIKPDAGQSYTLEINLQDDDNGDNIIPAPNGSDDEFQYNLVVSPVGPGAVAGGGWQRISIPLTDFFDDNSFHFGGNGILDPIPVGAGGNGQLVNVVIAIIGTGGSQTLRTDRWEFVQQMPVSVGDFGGVGARILMPCVPNPFRADTQISFELPRPGAYRLDVYDLRGRLVRSLSDGNRAAGVQRVRWDGELTNGIRASAGIYLLRLEHGGGVESRKVVLQH